MNTISSTTQKSHPLIEAGNYESVYDCVLRDLQTEPKGKIRPTVKIFSYKELGMQQPKKLTWKQRLQKGREEFQEIINPVAPMLWELGIECSWKLPLWKRIRNALRAMIKTAPLYAGDIFAEINEKMKTLGWEMGSLGDMLAYEATEANRHEYPLFGIGRLYEHSYSCGEASRLPPDRIVPVIIKTETGNRKLEQYDVCSEPFTQGQEEFVRILPEGYFIAMR